MKNLLKISLLMVLLVAFTSCSKDDNPTATVNSSISASTGNFNGDVLGNGGDASKTFTWPNSEVTADYNMDITSSVTGAFRFQMMDADGTTVLDRTLNGSLEPDSFSGVTNIGVAGDWTVTLTLTNFNGDGSYSASSGN
jgi:hypothetical protein